MRRWLHRWRFRTRRVAHLRSWVVKFKCPKCGAQNWEYGGEQPIDPFYSAFAHVWYCRGCGYMTIDR